MGVGVQGEEEKMNTRVTRERFKLSDPRIHQAPELQDSSPERHLFPNVFHWMEARHNPSLGPGKPYVQKPVAGAHTRVCEFDFLKYGLKIVFILITQVFGTPFNLAPEMYVSCPI